MTRQRTAELRGAFADRLPPAKPTLRQLAERAIADCAMMHKATDREFNAACDAAYDSRAAFLNALTDATGLDRRLIGALCHEGILL